MNTSYADIKIDSGRYFIKSFGLASTSKNIRGNSYWRLTDDIKSHFMLSGYLRKQNDSIMFVPYDYSNWSLKIPEYKLFDFNVKSNSSWVIRYASDKNNIHGYSIRLVNTKVVDENKYFEFEFRAFISIVNSDDRHFIGRTFKLDVNPLLGIVSITQSDLMDSTSVYKATLYPTQKFENHGGNSLEL